MSPRPEFGQHIVQMTPDHAVEHQAEFGECVSTMAQGLDCRHDH